MTGSPARRITTAILNRGANIISSRVTRIKHVARGVDKIATRLMTDEAHRGRSPSASLLNFIKTRSSERARARGYSVFCRRNPGLSEIG